MQWNKSRKLAAFLAIILAGLLGYPFQFAGIARADSDEAIAAKDEDDGDREDRGRGRGRGRDDDKDDDDDDEDRDEDRNRLVGPIESLSPATGTPNQLNIFGVTFNIGGAEIELDKNRRALDARDLVAAQFVELRFTGANADRIRVAPAAARGPLQNLVVFSSPPSVTVNRNTRTINATFTVDGAGILCQNTFTRVQVSPNISSCADLAGLVNNNVRVEGLLVGTFALSLTDLTTAATPRNVILASRVRRD